MTIIIPSEINYFKFGKKLGIWLSLLDDRQFWNWGRDVLFATLLRGECVRRCCCVAHVSAGSAAHAPAGGGGRAAQCGLHCELRHQSPSIWCASVYQCKQRKPFPVPCATDYRENGVCPDIWRSCLCNVSVWSLGRWFFFLQLLTTIGCPDEVWQSCLEWSFEESISWRLPSATVRCGAVLPE